MEKDADGFYNPTESSEFFQCATMITRVNCVQEQEPEAGPSETAPEVAEVEKKEDKEKDTGMFYYPLVQDPAHTCFIDVTDLIKSTFEVSVSAFGCIRPRKLSRERILGYTCRPAGRSQFTTI